MAAALANGAAPYLPERERYAMGAVRASAADAEAEAQTAPHALRFAAYATPALPGAGGAGGGREPGPAKQPGAAARLDMS